MADPIEFDVVLRGYDRRQVDAVVQRAALALGSSDPALRAAVRDELRSTRLNITLRGFDRLQVDTFVQRTVAVLDAVH
jgi:DivIVA domain-containing protein